MKENISNFKNWFRIARPSRKYWLIAFFTALITCICGVIEPIFAAKVITSITASNYLWTCIFLAIGFCFVIMRKMTWDINYRIYYKLIRHTYMNLQKKIFAKIINAKDSNFEKNSKEKLINIIHSASFEVSDFADLLATRLARFMRVIITVVAIFAINVSVGLVIILIDIINYFVLNYLNNKTAAAKKEINEVLDIQYTKFSEVLSSKYIANDLNIIDKVEEDYLQSCENYIKAKNKQSLAQSKKDNYYHIYYQLIILALTIFLVFLVAQGNISLTLYFIVIPYLTSGIEIANDFMEVLSELKNATVSANRLKIILNFTDKEIIEFGANDNDDILGNLDFINVTYQSKNKEDKNPAIKNITFNIKEKETVLFYGQKNCGKRTIFNLLRRNIKQNEGEVYVDGINILDYSEEVHRTNINYLTTKPYFFSGSIIKNLKMVDSNIKRIVEICKELGILTYINSLPKSFKTNINDLPEGKKYLIQLARTLLTSSEIVILYEFPNTLSVKEKEAILVTLNKIKGTRTILIFSANDYAKNICSQIIKLDNGKIKK